MRRSAYAALAATAAFAMSIQLSGWLAGSSGTPGGVAQAVGGFLFFFTTWANLAVAVAAGRLAWRFDGVFARPRAATALAACVAVVCGVYELFLRHRWHPTGLTLVVDTLAHDVVPAGYLLLWAACVPKGALRPRDVLAWLVIPLAYGAWVLTLGAATGQWPYPFLDVPGLGWPRVVLHGAGMVGVFGAVGLAFVVLDEVLAAGPHAVWVTTDLPGVSQERCFDLARDVGVHVRTAGHTGERVVAGRSEGLLALGDTVTFEARHLGVRQRLSASVVAFERPDFFRDRMTRGAFRALEHDHRFGPLPGGGTRMTDELRFVVPGGPLGRPVGRWVVAPHLRRFLVRRGRALRGLAGGNGGGSA